MTIKIGLAKTGDVDEVLKVENAAWPSTDGSMVADRKKFEIRQSIGGLLVAKHLGDEENYYPNEVIGMISFQRASWTDHFTVQYILEHENHNWGEIVNKHKFPPTWYAATNDGYIIKDRTSTHDPTSLVGHLIGVAIHPKGRGRQLVDKLISAAISHMRSEGLKYAIGYGRLPAYHQYSNIPIDQYVKMKKLDTNLPYDYGLRFHVRNGANFICPIPNAMWDDEESLRWGALLIYKL